MTEQNTEAPEQQEQSQEGGDEQQEAPKTFDADYVDKLRKEAAKYRTEAKANADAAAKLAEIEEAKKSDEQKLTDRAASAEDRATKAEQRADRAEIALDKGLTLSQAKRLVGNTREELEADADELLKDLEAAGKPRPPKPDPSQGRTPGRPDPGPGLPRLRDAYASN